MSYTKDAEHKWIEFQFLGERFCPHCGTRQKAIKEIGHRNYEWPDAGSCTLRFMPKKAKTHGDEKESHQEKDHQKACG